jgi:hypothetical protein
MDTGPLREFAFSEANTLSGNMSATDYTKHIAEFCAYLEQSPHLKPEYIALLDLPSAHSLTYIKKRARTGEENLKLDYLEMVRHCHLTNIANLREGSLRLALKDNAPHPLSGSKRFIFRRHTFVEPEDIIGRITTWDPDYY